MTKKCLTLTGVLSLMASAVLLVACQSKTDTETSKSKDVPWGYTGATGPEHWGDLSKIMNSAKMVKNNLQSISQKLKMSIFQN